MGGGGNVPAQLLDLFLSHLFEATLLISGALVAVLLALESRARRRGPARSSAGGPNGPGRAAGSADRVEPGGETTGLWSNLEEREPTSRRVLRLGIGFIWILDGLLQAQPAMPSQFVPMIVEPAVAGQPAWLRHIARLGVDVWTTHTITVDAFTVAVQVAIGLLIVVGADRTLGRLGLSASVLWGFSVWVLGEGMGGVLGRGATWLAGDPGAVLFYIVAAVLLLLVPTERWREPTVGRWCLRAIGGFWVLAAVVQAWPAEGFWRGSELREVFVSAASNPQPRLLAAPIWAVARFAGAHPGFLNAWVVGVMAVLGVGLLSGRAWRFFVAATAVWLAVTWYLGMDFGVVGGTGTDPNAAPLVGLFLAMAVVAQLARQPVEAGDRLVEPLPKLVSSSGSPRRPLLQVFGLWLAVAAVLATGWTGVAVAATLPQAVSTPVAETPALVESGGLASIPGTPPAPNFHLVDQHDRPVELSQWRGKVVVLSFLDPVCYSTCPIVAEEMAQVARLLAPRRRQIELVAVDANPAFTSPADLRAFDHEHGLSGLSNWQYVTGAPSELRQVWDDFGAVSQVPRVGMVAHSLLVYVISPAGREVAVTEASGTPGSAIEEAYATLFADEAASLLPHR